MANTKLSAWEKVEIARNPKRKTSLDYIENIDNNQEFHENNLRKSRNNC